MLLEQLLLFPFGLPDLRLALGCQAVTSLIRELRS